MPYTLTFSLVLGSSQTGLDLEAQLVDTAGVDVGALVDAGFVEHGRGSYAWTGAIPDGFRGSVVFSADAEVKAAASINPEEAENVDEKVSSRADAAEWTPARAELVDHLDADVSSRAAAATVADLSAAVAVIAPLVDDLEGRLTATRAGNLDRLDAAVSSRASVAAADAISTLVGNLLPLVDELESRLTAPRAAKLDNLDAAVTSRLATGDYTAPPTAGEIAGAIDLSEIGFDAVVEDVTTLLERLTDTRAALIDNLERLDVDVSTVAMVAT